MSTATAISKQNKTTTKNPMVEKVCKKVARRSTGGVCGTGVVMSAQEYQDEVNRVNQGAKERNDYYSGLMQLSKELIKASEIFDGGVEFNRVRTRMTEWILDHKDIVLFE
jgi:hypothetical protein